MQAVLWLLLLLSLGCATTTYHVQDVKTPLSCIKKAIAYGIPGGIRKRNNNHRTFFSKYVDLDGRKWDPLGNKIHRAFVEVTILGNRRPYELNIVARVEERASDDPMDTTFRLAGTSSELAYKATTMIESKLENCRGDLIDDFRAF